MADEASILQFRTRVESHLRSPASVRPVQWLSTLGRRDAITFSMRSLIPTNSARTIFVLKGASKQKTQSTSRADIVMLT